MKTIICVASHEELPENFHAGANTEVFITGIGLVNAAIALSEKLNEHYGPCRVLNIGTCGAIEGKIGEYFEVSQVSCGFEESLSKFTPPLVVGKYGEKLYSSNYFIGPEADVSLYGDSKLFDMECYALASVCARHNVGFSSYKVISDSFDFPIDPTKWVERARKVQASVGLCCMIGLTKDRFTVPTTLREASLPPRIKG